MSDEIADVLGQVVELGPNARQAELGAAVSRHVSNRPSERPEPDPEALAALRSFAATANAEIENVERAAMSSPLMVTVDVNALLADFGEPKAWEILGKLKDLFG
jgi:hypothetical protein